ncbi:MAG: hypothetical protein M3137_09615, partial [Actinomycetota bacterium]|nr:hypothetical protein [Actinomycetota bacterium]
ARGRATRIRKRTTHITVIVSRLPEDRLRRLQAHRRAEQLVERSRRVAGARRSGAADGDTRPRSERRYRDRSAEEVTAAEEEAGIVDPTGEGVAAMERAEDSSATAGVTTGGAETPSGADAAGITDQTGEAVAALREAEADGSATETTKAELPGDAGKGDDGDADADDAKDGR